MDNRNLWNLIQSVDGIIKNSKDIDLIKNVWITSNDNFYIVNISTNNQDFDGSAFIGAAGYSCNTPYQDNNIYSLKISKDYSISKSESSWVIEISTIKKGIYRKFRQTYLDKIINDNFIPILRDIKLNCIIDDK